MIWEPINSANLHCNHNNRIYMIIYIAEKWYVSVYALSNDALHESEPMDTLAEAKTYAENLEV